MRPINIVIIVITVIESLRAFDIVYVINRGTNGLELISALVIQNLVGEGQVIGVGSALAVILLVISLVPIIVLPVPHVRKGQRGMSIATIATAPARRQARRPPGRHASRPTGQRGKRALRHPHLPDRDGGHLAGPAGVDGLHRAAAQGGHRQVRLLQPRRHASTSTTSSQAWTQGGFAQYFWNSADHHGPVGDPDPVLRLDDGVRRQPGQLEVQRHAADHVHRRQPAAAAGARGAAVRDVQARSSCPTRSATPGTCSTPTSA